MLVTRARSSSSCRSTARSWTGCVAPADASDEELEEIARASEKVARRMNGKQIVKAVVVPGKLVNFVVR